MRTDHNCRPWFFRPATWSFHVACTIPAFRMPCEVTRLLLSDASDQSRRPVLSHLPIGILKPCFGRRITAEGRYFSATFLTSHLPRSFRKFISRGKEDANSTI